MAFNLCRHCEKVFEYIFIKKTRTVCDPCKKERHRKRVKKYCREYNQRPEVKENGKKYRARPEIKARLKENHKRHMQHPGNKELKHERERERYKKIENIENRKARRRRPEYRKKQANYEIKRRAEEPKFRLNTNISRAINHSLNGRKKNRHWEDLVGYTIDNLKNHLESKFRKGMSWENYGLWHIDHKIPKAIHNITKPEDEDFRRCWGLDNLQPLWAKDNLRKGSKLPSLDKRI